MSLCEKFPGILRLILLLAILRASDTAVGWAQPNSSTDRIAPAKKEGLINLYTSWDLDRSGGDEATLREALSRLAETLKHRTDQFRAMFGIR